MIIIGKKVIFTAITSVILVGALIAVKPILFTRADTPIDPNITPASIPSVPQTQADPTNAPQTNEPTPTVAPATQPASPNQVSQSNSCHQVCAEVCN